MTDKPQLDRRAFLRHAAGAVTAATQPDLWSPSASSQAPNSTAADSAPPRIAFPRKFSGRQLRMISFPLGGVAAGSIGLGGRGQLVNWEIFNRPNKGHRPSYSFPSIWVQSGSDTPVARVLESRMQPPYEGQDGLGSDNVPGLSRLESAVFTGGYPLAHIDFADRSLPVRVELDAFSPFIPHDPDDSGLPVAILRYRVANPLLTTARVAIAFSIENPTSTGESSRSQRINDFRSEQGIAGLVMSNPSIMPTDPMFGEFVLAATTESDQHISHWIGWPAGGWWNSPLLFWDQFSKSGELGTPPAEQNKVGALCLRATILPGQSASFQFILGWRFPNRTPEWCGWESAPGDEKTNIGNYYAVRFPSAWEAVRYAAVNLPTLEQRTRSFTDAFASSDLPDEVKDAASANLSTLATTTCFRTADGEFHGFEGSDDARGCCHGNCTHVWNYETVTPFLFPSFARSLRRAAFGNSMNEAGAMGFRQTLPDDGKHRWGFAAADGQMGQVLHAWLDWKISGDDALLHATWPRAKKALEFAWIPGGWDANRDGVLEGVQHNTYDVEFYGPNPLCGIYYLGALRAGEEMARAAGDEVSARMYRSLFDRGSRWFDANLFNGEYYIQKVRGFKPSEIAANLRSDMGSADTVDPQYQVGAGCLIDQLVGQYLADAGGLGPLVAPANIRATLASIYRYNLKPSVEHHDNVARTYVLNDESAVVVCDYGKADRPTIPFPYYPEAWTGTEYTAAALMMSWGMPEQGIEIMRNSRRRFDGEKRNPWDEAECGHHYARAMSAWSAVLALSGFRYDGPNAAVSALPPTRHDAFRCLWATGTGWGTFALLRSGSSTSFRIRTIAGTLACRTCEFAATGAKVNSRLRGNEIKSQLAQKDDRALLTLPGTIHLAANEDLEFEVFA